MLTIGSNSLAISSQKFIPINNITCLNDCRKPVKKVGSFCWLSLAICILELLICIKFGHGEFDVNFLMLASNICILKINRSECVGL